MVPDKFRASVIATMTACILAAVSATTQAQVTYECDALGRCGGQLNISGATLFRPFFTTGASTTDWMNVDSDTIALFPDCGNPNADEVPFRGFNLDFCATARLDQLAPNWTFGGWEGWWLVQYRGVGSGNGLAEFVQYQLTRDEPNPVIAGTIPAELGLINRFVFAEGGASTGACCIVYYADPNTPDPDNVLPPVCEQLTPATCAALAVADPAVFSSTSLGEQTTCEGGACGEAALGCCRYGEPVVAQRLTEAQCAANSGVWSGAGTLCEPFDESGTPVLRETTDLAVMDVPTTWFVTQPGPGYWGAPPNTPGYGNNPIKSWDQGQKNTLKSLSFAPFGSLNLNLVDPDENTVYDTPIAYVPIGFLANPRAGLNPAAGQLKDPVTGAYQATITQLRYLFVTGRWPNGRNYIAATRDSGSGTRNGAMNSIGVDPSWGLGDNLGVQTGDSDTDVLGPLFQATNKGGSSRIEGAVQNAGLAIGYTGLYGESRAIADAISHRYEIMNVKFDDRGGTVYVRPTVEGSLANCDPDTGWQIGGPETFASRGNPFETDPNSPAYMYDPASPGQPYPPVDPNEPWFNYRPSPDPHPVYPTQSRAADYLRNIDLSIHDLGGAKLAPDEADNSPGEFLASAFFLQGGIACTGERNFAGDPTVYVPNPTFNPAVQDLIRQNQIFITPDPNDPIERTPIRLDLTGRSEPPFAYSDGSIDGTYVNRHTDDPANPSTFSIGGGSTLPTRNRTMADFHLGDGLVRADDVRWMLYALHDPTGYVNQPQATSSAANPVVAEIIGDLNADGDFDADDVRYLADGYFVEDASGHVLSRQAVFALVDEYWQELTGDNNFFNTAIHDCEGNRLNDPVALADPAWIPGASCADIAGRTPYRGAFPNGHDGLVDCTDAAYVRDNRGDWRNLDEAALLDLSADMNGDLGIDGADLAVLAGYQGCECFAPAGCRGDYDCNGAIDFFDIDLLLAALGGERSWADKYQQKFGAPPPCGYLANADANGDGAVDFFDIDAFLDLLGTDCP